MSIRTGVNLSALDGTTPRYEKTLESLVIQPPEPALDAMAVKLICALVANGESLEMVVKKTGIELATVEELLATPRAQDMIVRLQAEMTLDPQMRIKKLATLAIDVQTRLLLNPKTPATILAALTRDILDRAHGKAVQITENRNLNYDIKDVDALDRALLAQESKVRNIELMQKKLAIAAETSTVSSGRGNESIGERQGGGMRVATPKSVLDKPHFIKD